MPSVLLKGKDRRGQSFLAFVFFCDGGGGLPAVLLGLDVLLRRRQVLVAAAFPKA
jgi:hypothetical protein